MREVIVDTSPLQYLHQVGLLDLLRRLYGQITVPGAVVRELAAGQAQGIVLPDVATLAWVSIRTPQHPGLLPLVTDLGAGEREALALAKETPEALVVLDDGLARRYARRLGLTMTGTLGILLRAKTAGYLDQVAPILDQLEALGFHLDAATRALALRLAGSGEAAP